MDQSFFSKYKIFFVILILIIFAIIGFYFFLRPRSETNLAEHQIVGAVSTPATPSPLTSPVSPISPLSPVPAERQPTPPDSERLQRMIDQGIRLHNEQDYEGALAIFNEVLSLDPHNFIAYNARGSSYLALGNYENALSDYSEAIRIQILFPHAYYNRGRVYGLLGEYDKAISDLQKSIELAPNEFGYRAYGNIGVVYHQMGEYDKALEAFAQSISYEDGKADVYYLRGETYTALENYEAATADYQAAIDRFSRYAEAYQSLGYAYYKIGEFGQARTALDQARQISADSPAAHFYLALVHLTNNEQDQAQTEISQAMMSVDALPEEEKSLILTRVLTDLEAFAQENPAQAENVEELVNLIGREQ